MTSAASNAKMALNNPISVDRDALREQQRQARAQMMDTKDPQTISAGLFAEPIFKVTTDDPLRRKIQRTLGEYNTFKETFTQSNPKNLIGITSQPQTPLPNETNQSTPHFSDILKLPKPPYQNGQFKTSTGSSNNNNSGVGSGSSGGGGHHHHHHHSHHHRGSSGGGGSVPPSSRSNNVPAGGTGGVASAARSINNNGWNNSNNNSGSNSSNVISQVKQPLDSYSTVKQKTGGFKPHSPVPQPSGNHSLAASALTSSQELTISRDQSSPAPTLVGDKLKSSAAVNTHLHTSTSTSLSASTTSTLKSGTGEHPRMNGTLFNGSTKPGYGRSGQMKPQLRLNIDEAVKANQDQTEIENILKEMIAPTPLTAIPTPRKDDTKFAFSAVAPLLTNSPSSDRSSSKPTVVRSLEKAFAAPSAPLPATDKLPAVTVSNNAGGSGILVNDLEISEDSDDEVENSGKKSVSDSRKESKLPNNSLPTNPPPQPVTATSESSSSESEDSSSDSESENEDRKSHSEHSEDEMKPSSPKQSAMNWNLNNFMPTQPAVPFGLHTDTSLPIAENISSNRHRHNSTSNSASKNVCDPSSSSNRRVVGGKKKERALPSNVSATEDDDDFGSVPDIKTLITSPRNSLSYTGGYPRNDEAFSKMIDDVPTISSPLSPQSPPHSTSSLTPASFFSSKARASLLYPIKKTSSVSPRSSRSPAAAPVSISSVSSSQSRESKSLVNRELKEKVGAKRGLLPDPIQDGLVEKERYKAPLSKEHSSKVNQKRPHKSASESTNKTKSLFGTLKEAACDEGLSKKSAGSISKRPKTPPGPPPPSPPPLVSALAKSVLLRQNSNGSTKSSETPASSSKVPTLPGAVGRPSSLANGSKIQSKSERKELDVKKNKKSSQGKKSKSSNKFQSKAIISDTDDSDSDEDIDVGMSSPPPQLPLRSKSPAVSEKGKSLDRISHFSSSTSLSSISDSIDDVSTGAGTVISAKSKSNNSTNSNSKLKKGKVAPQVDQPQQLPTTKSKSASQRDLVKSKSSSSHRGSSSSIPNSVAEEWCQIPAPLSPLRDDFKEERAQLKSKESSQLQTKISPIAYRDGIPSLIVSLDKSLLYRLPAFPPTQLRLTSDSSSSSSKKLEAPEKKVKPDSTRLDNSSLPIKNETKPKQGTNYDSVGGGKENNQTGISSKSKLDSKSSNKRPLQEPDRKLGEIKKMKTSTKEKELSSESIVQASMKVKLTPNDRPFENGKIKKEEFQNESIVGLKNSNLKNSPANRMPQSPADLEKKLKRPSSHKSPSSKRDKKHSSSSSTVANTKKEKSSRENEFLPVKTLTEPESDLFRQKKNNYECASGTETKKESSAIQGDFGVAASSSLTTLCIPKESKQRGRDNSDATDVKKRKWSGSSNSSTSQATSLSSLTETQKAITSDGIERNTNHDRIPSANDFTSNRTSSSSSGSTSAIFKDWNLVLNRINEIVDVKRHVNGEHYLNHAKNLKHEADKEAERTIQLAKYLHATLYFTLSWMVQETERGPASKALFNNTLDLIKFITTKFRSPQSTNGNLPLENKVAVLSLWCQAILSLRQYHLKKKEVQDFQKTITEYHKTPMHRSGNRQVNSPGQSSSNVVPNTLWSNKTNGAPSPMSPLPSPAGSVGSVESQSSGYSSSEIGQQSRSSSAVGNNGGSSGFNHSGGGSSVNSTAALTNPVTISIPVHIHSTMQKQLVNLNFLSSAFDSWEQAESLIIRGGNQDFFTGLDERCGKLTPCSPLRDMLRHVLLGLYQVGINIL